MTKDTSKRSPTAVATVIKGCLFVAVLGLSLRTFGVPFCSFMIGGLKPIPSRITLDYLALILLAISTFLPRSKAKAFFLTITLAFSVITAGSPTNRWTLTIPVAISLALQALRRLPPFQADLPKRFLSALTILCCLTSASLCILFPATQIPNPTGKYNVGLMDLHLPVNLAAAYTGENFSCSDTTDGFVSIRIMYPTKEDPVRVPYVKPDIALQYLKVSMQFGAPPPLNKLSWFLDNWRLAEISAKPYAKPIQVDGGFPIVVYSHGMGGHSTVYTYQSMMLASNGNVVLQINHADGSAPVVERKDGDLLHLDFSLHDVWAAGEEEEYTNRRRDQTDHRVVEMLASVFALQNLNHRDIPETKGVSFVNKLKISEIHLMGHSFGGATALTAAFRRPELAFSVIAHEPVSDWMPDDARRALFPVDIMANCPFHYEGGTGGLPLDAKQTQATIKDIDIMFLFSSEWYYKNWGRCDIIEWMHDHGKLCQACTTSFDMIWNAHHNEFSDSCMMTPVWLARAVGLTGKRNPIETSEEISQRTLKFLEQVRLRKS